MLTADLPLMDAVEGLSPLESLKSLLTALPSPSRPALLQHVLDALLSAVAGALPVSHMLLGDTSTRDAARVIASTARGAGWSLPLDLKASRALPNDVVRIKAMREASAKEAALWCHGRGLPASAERRWDAGGKSARGKEVASLEALTERESRITAVLTVRLHCWPERQPSCNGHHNHQDGSQADIHGQGRHTVVPTVRAPR